MFIFVYICIQKLWDKPIIEIIGIREGLLLGPKRTVELFIVYIFIWFNFSAM